MRKKIVLSLLVAVLLAGSSTHAYAAEEVKESHATVSFEKNDELIYSDVSTDGSETKLGNSFEGIAPGEKAAQVITVENNNKRTADFYMNAESLRALEDGKDAAKGAGYEIQLTAGKEVLYDSTAGGYAGRGAEGSKEGINAMNDGALEDYVLIGTLQPGDSEEVRLQIFFDGEAMDNTAKVSDYSKALGKLGFSFKVAYEDPEGPKIIYKEVKEKGKDRVVRKVVEIFEEGTPLGDVATGDQAMIGLAVLGLAAGIIVVVVASRKTKAEEK